jgi:hypothetical protein
VISIIEAKAKAQERLLGVSDCLPPMSITQIQLLISVMAQFYFDGGLDACSSIENRGKKHEAPTPPAVRL